MPAQPMIPEPGAGLKALLSDEFYIPYFPTMAHALGGPSLAVFITYLAKWEKYSEDGWVFRTQDEIFEDTALSPEMQRGARSKLVAAEIIEQERRGVPGRWFYRIDWANLEATLQTWEMGKSKPPLQTSGNPRSRRGERPDLSNRDTTKFRPNGRRGDQDQADQEPDAPSSRGVSEKGKPKKAPTDPRSKPLVQEIYDRLLEDEGIRLLPDDFKFHLGRANVMFFEDDPSPEEVVRIPAEFVKLYGAIPNPDPQKALRDLRRDRVNQREKDKRDEARSRRRLEIAEEPAPWEQENPHSDKAEDARKKARKVEWYTASYPEIAPGLVKSWIERDGLNHPEIIERIEYELAQNRAEGSE